MSRNLKLLIALIIVASAATYVVVVVIPAELAERTYKGARTLGEDIRAAFQVTPEIRVGNTIVLNQQSDVFELAVAQQNFEHRYEWQHSWLGSTKRIFISGTFTAKIGFNLQEKFSITLRDDKAYVVVPAPSALSVELLGNVTYRDEQGIWNWVDMDDRTRATNAFIRDARRYANNASFVADAKARLERQLRPLLQHYAKEVVIGYQQPLDLP